MTTPIDDVLDRIFELMSEEASVSESKRYGSRDEGFDSPQLRRLRDDARIFDAGGDLRAASGLYRFSFTPPKDKAKICFCFSSTTETDSREGLMVRSVSAKSSDGGVAAYADLGDTVVSFENVKAGHSIEADIEFAVDHYCYAEIRYYEKKNI